MSGGAMRASSVGLRLKDEIKRLPVSISGAARKVGKARNTIYNWIARGNIPAYQLMRLADLGVDTQYVTTGTRAADGMTDRIAALCQKIDACLARVEAQRVAPCGRGGRPPEHLRIEADIARALGLRAEGKSYQEIAQAMGCTKPHAWRLIHIGPNVRTKPYKARPSDFRPECGINGAGQPLAAPERDSAARRAEG